MSLTIDKFVNEIYFGNKEFTPEELGNWISKRARETPYASKQKLELLSKSALGVLEETVKKYKLDTKQTLKVDKSEAGKRLAELGLNYNSAILTLMREGGFRSGSLL